MNKDAVAQVVELIANHLYGHQGLQVLAYMEILASNENIEFRYNNQLFAVYCSNDLSVAYAKCQCGVKNLLHDYTYVRSAHWELYFRGHLLEWQFSPSNPKVIEETNYAKQ
jgi:hypothetical protein